MTYNHYRFAELLAQTPWLEPYWNFERGECDFERLKRDMGVWSSGERIMARFLHAVWAGENMLEFDPIEAAAALDAKNRAIVSGWIADPFWP